MQPTRAPDHVKIIEPHESPWIDLPSDHRRTSPQTCGGTNKKYPVSIVIVGSAHEGPLGVSKVSTGFNKTTLNLTPSSDQARAFGSLPAIACF